MSENDQSGNRVHYNPTSHDLYGEYPASRVSAQRDASVFDTTPVRHNFQPIHPAQPSSNARQPPLNARQPLGELDVGSSPSIHSTPGSDTRVTLDVFSRATTGRPRTPQSTSNVYTQNSGGLHIRGANGGTEEEAPRTLPALFSTERNSSVSRPTPHNRPPMHRYSTIDRRSPINDNPTSHGRVDDIETSENIHAEAYGRGEPASHRVRVEAPPPYHSYHGYRGEHTSPSTVDSRAAASGANTVSPVSGSQISSPKEDDLPRVVFISSYNEFMGRKWYLGHLRNTT